MAKLAAKETSKGYINISWGDYTSWGTILKFNGSLHQCNKGDYNKLC
jgi:hypothetical protein